MGRARGGPRHGQLSRKWELLSFLASALRRLLPPHVARLSFDKCLALPHNRKGFPGK